MGDLILYWEVVENFKKLYPKEYEELLKRIAKSKTPHSEIVRYTDAEGNQKSTTNTGAGFLSGSDPVGVTFVEAMVGDKILGDIGRYLKVKAISNILDKSTPIKKGLPLNVGWGPKQTIKDALHATDSLEPLQLFFDKRWDVTHEGANPFGVWYLGKWGLPRTAATNSLPGKAEKAEKARKVFADRKYKHEGDLTLDKPITTVGEVPDRSVLSYEAEKMGADGIVYNNVYDNGFDNNLVIISFKTPEKTSINVVKENAHKLSDQEWDQIYEAALKEGDAEKLKELRALHFQVKSGNDPLVRTITYDDNGNFIPLSKRDDFANPDFRYKNGGLVKKHLLGGIVEAGTSFIPIAGTYQSYQDYKKDPSWSNLGWTLASGVGDVLQLTGVGYGLGSAIKGLKAANAARKAVKAVNTARKTTRAANQVKMLEYGPKGKNAFKGWVQSGKNVANSNKKLAEANKHLKDAALGLGIASIDPAIDVSEITFKQ